jgi:orotate phosphoribosyltransferase
MIDITEMLRVTKAVATGHFVYKARFNHGMAYVDKDMFPYIGASNLVEILEAGAEKALQAGLDLSPYKVVTLLTPAYGAIKLGLPVAAYLERQTGVRVFVAETEVERNDQGRRIHIIPENQKRRIMGIPAMGQEDIVNDGTTLRETRELAKKELNVSMFAALAILDRGSQTAETLGIPFYCPHIRINMEQYDVRTGPCPLCEAGIPIAVDLGKGAEWVNMFGQPPYPTGMDFSPFWAKKEGA